MIDYTIDVRVVELCREAEQKRRWNRALSFLKQVNWAALAAITTLVLFDGACLVSIIWAWRHFQ